MLLGGIRIPWRRIIKNRLLFVVIIILVAISILRNDINRISVVGLDIYMSETSYRYFKYPMEGNIEPYVSQLRSGLEPHVPPINTNYIHPFSISNLDRCKTENGKSLHVNLLLVVKSAVPNLSQRAGIRQSWGKENGSFSNIVIRRVFNLGSLIDDEATQQNINEEQRAHGDIIQSEFVDNYYNNTIKTMQGMRWVLKYCSNVDFVMFVDDDVYVSVRNVLRFLLNPLEYSALSKTREDILKDFDMDGLKISEISKTQVDFFAGDAAYVPPRRDKISKWYISVKDYPFDAYPPFIPGAAFIMSFRTLQKVYYTSFYTKHFFFDDIYLGFVAKKAGIGFVNNENFQYYRQNYVPHVFKSFIVAHDYQDPKELIEVWTDQRNLGYA